MKTLWPSELIFKFICDNKLISNLLVYVVLLSKLKNNFTIGYFITNRNGEIRIAKGFMLKAIETAKADYPMDYCGTLDDCSGIEIVVETINELKIQIERGREFYPDKANELQKLVQKCKNRKYNGESFVYKQPIKFKLSEVNIRKA